MSFGDASGHLMYVKLDCIMAHTQVTASPENVFLGENKIG